MARGIALAATLGAGSGGAGLAAPLAPAETALPRMRIELLTLNGFDPVTYFLDDGPRPGTARYELSWGGRVWRFSSGANRAAFRDDPEAYAPRLGGYDAAGILEGRLVDADPMVFAVIGDRLYLFRDAARRARFLAEPGLAGQAEAAWPALLAQQDAPFTDAPR
jgi:YHS domain-containing protein